MNSNEDKLYIKIVALDAIYKFVVENLLNQHSLRSQNIIISLEILNFKI